MANFHNSNRRINEDIIIPHFLGHNGQLYTRFLFNYKACDITISSYGNIFPTKDQNLMTTWKYNNGNNGKEKIMIFIHIGVFIVKPLQTPIIGSLMNNVLNSPHVQNRKLEREITSSFSCSVEINQLHQFRNAFTKHILGTSY